MKPVIAEEAARQEIKEWAEFFESSLNEDEIKSLLPAVMHGRVTFDTEAETFKMQLRCPISLENGESVTVLTMREPNTQELQDIAKLGGDEMTMTLKVFSRLSGQPLGVLQRMKQRDLIALSGLYSFFA